MQRKVIINTACSDDLGNRHGHIIYVTDRAESRKKYRGDELVKFLGTGGESIQDYKNKLMRNKGCLLLEKVVSELFRHWEITLICFCKDITKCHRVVLAKWLAKYYPETCELGLLK